jgi:quercetin dioxygenase-like cupin family protein
MYLEVLTNPVTGETLKVLESNSAVFKVEYNLRQGGAVPADHYHPWQEQIISVVSGELHCRIGKETRILRAGDKARIPPGVTHTQWNPTETEAVAIEELRPAGESHNMFRVVFALARDGKTNSKGIPKPLIGAALTSVFKDEVRPSGLGLRLLFGSLSAISRLLGYERIIHRYINKLA